jgi:flagellar hook-associated protein 2
MTSAHTGAANGFTVTASGGLSQFAYDPTSSATQPMTQTQAPQDASFSVNGLSLTSASNAVTSAVKGLTINLTQAPASGSAPLQSQVTVSSDTNSINSAVNSFVTAYNSYVNLSSSLTSYDATSKKGSQLSGDPSANASVRTLQTILGGSTSATGTTSTTKFLAQIGITTSTNGTLSVNTATLDAAIQSNPSAVTAMFAGIGSSSGGNGFAVQINNAVTQLLSSSGALGAAQGGLNNQLTYLQNKATLLQQNLTTEQNNLLQEYSTLNANVTAAQAQQVQIANEMANLPG